MTASPSISVVIPSYRREQVLLDTLQRVLLLLQNGDELLVVDQTPQHELAVEQQLLELATAGALRWVRRSKPHICEAMNLGALLAIGELILFIDDDVIPSPSLLEAHRVAHAVTDPPPVTCGQVLQPWNAGPTQEAATFDLGFPFNYNKACDVLDLIGCNFAVRRDWFLRIGGIDESFSGSCYRFEAELSHRIFRHTGRKVRFVPEASIQHLHVSDGGTRAFGAKDTWGNIGSSDGDYYFAMRSLPFFACICHCLRRLLRNPVNRYTVKHPWLILSLYLRESVAWLLAAWRIWTRPAKYIKSAAAYSAVEPIRRDSSLQVDQAPGR